MLLQTRAIQIGRKGQEADGAVVDIGWMSFSGMSVAAPRLRCDPPGSCGNAVNAFGKAVLSFEECQFVGNGHAYGLLHGTLNLHRLISLAMKGCSFVANKAYLGGAAFIYSVKSVTMTNCSFLRNEVVCLHFC